MGHLFGRELSFELGRPSAFLNMSKGSVMSLGWVAITLMAIGILGALFRRQMLMVSLNVDVALLGVALAIFHGNQQWQHPWGDAIAFGLLALVLIHQIVMFFLTQFLFEKLKTTQLSAWRNLRG